MIAMNVDSEPSLNRRSKAPESERGESEAELAMIIVNARSG